jgi:tRNA(fMet)-specific endonuclease VapC
MFMLNTNIVIAFFNGEPSISEKILNNIDNIVLSSLVIAELDYGAKSSLMAIKNLEKLYNFVELIKIMPFDFECAKTLGTIKSKLRKLGKPTGEVDALIAATAITYNAKLVTRNRKHFENIDDLNLVIWE